MVEVDFERRLERLFAEAPQFPDASAFAARVEGRLDRGWMARRWLIGAAGAVGGVIGASQLIMSNFIQRVETAEDSVRLMGSSLADMAPSAELLTALSAVSSGMWVAVALAVVTMGFALSRVIEEI